MITQRPLSEELQTFLESRQPFKYCHLVKFERPSLPDRVTNKIDTSAKRYIHINDGSRDVEFDDGTVDIDGNPNGVQTYLAGKLLKVSAVSEFIEARATNHTIEIDGNALGAFYSGVISVTVVDSKHYDIQFSEDIRPEGFREGDKIVLSGERTGSFNIVNFRANNVVRVSTIDDTLTAGSNLFVTVALGSEEILAVLQDKNSPNYVSYINREVFIYKAYFSMDGQLKGTLLIFKGIVQSASLEDDDSGIKIKWTLNSHWGDFSEVRGRITSDDFHRALDSIGVPQPDSAIKRIYAFDKGFIHSETSLNILANYTVQVEKQRVKAKKGFFGIGAKVKVKKYFEDETRTTELDFQLQGKSIPVVYGVRNLKGIPFFADTLNNDSSTVILAYALSEGEISSIYDMYIGEKSLICSNKADFDTRSTQPSDNTVDILCKGRADRGDVLGGQTSVDYNILQDYYLAEDYAAFNIDYNFSYLTAYRPYVAPETNTPVSIIGKGVINEESVNIDTGQQITLDFFSGKENQKASSYLVDIAANKNFKIQNDYWRSDDTAEYWGPNHRVLDTAYVVAKFKIEEGETTIPEIEFIVKGKLLNCYNFDYSYDHYLKAPSESPDNFDIGDVVRLEANGNTINDSVEITDKWTYVDAEGALQTRFNFSEVPALNYQDGIPSIKKFSMVKGSNTWTMVTWNYVEAAGTVSIEISTPVTSVTNNDGNVQINYEPNPIMAIGTPPPSSGVGGRSFGWFNNENVREV